MLFATVVVLILGKSKIKYIGSNKCIAFTIALCISVMYVRYLNAQICAVYRWNRDLLYGCSVVSCNE